MPTSTPRTQNKYRSHVEELESFPKQKNGTKKKNGIDPFLTNINIVQKIWTSSTGWNDLSRTHNHIATSNFTRKSPHMVGIQGDRLVTTQN